LKINVIFRSYKFDIKYKILVFNPEQNREYFLKLIKVNIISNKNFKFIFSHNKNDIINNNFIDKTGCDYYK